MTLSPQEEGGFQNMTAGGRGTLEMTLLDNNDNSNGLNKIL